METRLRKTDPLGPVYLERDSIYSTSVCNNRDFKVAILLAALLPGAGQVYNYQVQKGLLFFVVTSLVLGVAIFSFVSYLLYFLGWITFGWILSFTLWPFLTYVAKVHVNMYELLSGHLEKCSGILCFPLRLMKSWMDYWIVSWQVIVTFLSFLATFPKPPGSDLILWILHWAYNQSIFVWILCGSLVVGVYLYQIYDAYITAIEINNGEKKIFLSRKRQLVEFFATTILPYVLLLLPIPHINSIVSFCFYGSETISVLLNRIDSNDMRVDAKQIIISHLKKVFWATAYEFIMYTACVLVLAGYLVWYLGKILLWAGTSLYCAATVCA